MWIYHIFVCYLSVNGHLGYFHILAIINSDAMNMHIQVFVCAHEFTSFEYTHGCEIAESYGNSTFHCKELSNGCQKELHHYTFSPAIYEDSNFYTSLQTVLTF